MLHLPGMYARCLSAVALPRNSLVPSLLWGTWALQKSGFPPARTDCAPFLVRLPSSRASHNQISVLVSHLDFAASCFHVPLLTAVFSLSSATYCGFVLVFNLPLMAVVEVGTNRYVFASNLRTVIWTSNRAVCFLFPAASAEHFFLVKQCQHVYSVGTAHSSVS